MTSLHVCAELIFALYVLQYFHIFVESVSVQIFSVKSDFQIITNNFFLRYLELHSILVTIYYITHR